MSEPLSESSRDTGSSFTETIGKNREECRLCGLPAGHSQMRLAMDGETFRFCCPGCFHVFQILFNSPEGPPREFRETDLYRTCVEAGLIPRDERDLAGKELSNPSSGSMVQSDAKHQDDLVEELSLRIEGMWCTACSWLIEEVLRSTMGVVDAKVFFLSDMARITYQPHRAKPSDILEKISKLGYRTSLFQSHSERDPEKTDLLLRLGVSSILTFNVMMISFALYGGFFQELEASGIGYLSYTLLILSTPVLFYGAAPIFKRAVSSIRCHGATMETLIAVGALSAYLYSVIETWKGGLHVYFDTATMLVTVVLLGKAIERHAREEVSRGVTELYVLASQKVRLLLDGKERWGTPEAVEQGDLFLVLAGERVPVDGVVHSGRGTLDESILTGEPRPVKKSMGHEVMAGTMLLEGELFLRATRVGTDSSINQMIALMQEALTRKNPVELLADRITRRVVPAILALAASTALFMWIKGFPGDEAMLRAVTILVITCPCALGIATPLAKVASIGLGRARGILVRDPSALEKAKDLDVIVFDKTGTLTEGNFSLREVITTGVDRDDVLRQVGAVEVHSNHFVAREIVRKAREIHPNLDDATDFASFEGLGVKGIVDGSLVIVGSRRFIQDQGLKIPPSIDEQAGARESQGSTTVFFAWDGELHGFFSFGDTLKKSAKRVISELHSRGIHVWILSGDSRETTHAVARELSIDRFVGQALPGDKLQVIKALQDKGLRVGMAGDGINDAAALAQADVGFALGTGGNIIREASDIALLSHDPSKVLEVIGLSAMTVRVIRQNLFFAFSYNLFGIPLAVAGLLNPIVAVVAMFASSLTVIGNTLRISRRKDSLGGGLHVEF